MLEKKKIPLSLFFFFYYDDTWMISILTNCIQNLVLRKLVSKSFSVNIFKLGTILTKNLFNTSAITSSSEIISSDSMTFSPSLGSIYFSIKVILELVCILSVKNGFTFFQKVLLSVISQVFNLL